MPTEKVINRAIVTNDIKSSRRVMSANHGETTHKKPAAYRKRGRPPKQTNKAPKWPENSKSKKESKQLKVSRDQGGRIQKPSTESSETMKISGDKGRLLQNPSIDSMKTKIDAAAPTIPPNAQSESNPSS